MNPPSLNSRHACPEVAAAQAAIRLDRMQTEFRRGRPVVMESADPGAPVAMLAAVETLSATGLEALIRTAGTPRLVLTAERLRALGGSRASGARSLRLGSPITVERLQRLAAVMPGVATTAEAADLVDARPAGPALERVLRLAKRARLVPALLVFELHAAALHELESGRLRTVLSEAVWAAYRRTVELGDQLEASVDDGRRRGAGDRAGTNGPGRASGEERLAAR